MVGVARSVARAVPRDSRDSYSRIPWPFWSIIIRPRFHTDCSSKKTIAWTSVTRSVGRWCSWSKNFVLFLWHVTANREDGLAVSQRGDDLVSAVSPEWGRLCLRVRARRAGFGAVSWRKCQILPLLSRLTISDNQLPCHLDFSSSSRSLFAPAVCQCHQRVMMALSNVRVCSNVPVHIPVESRC